MKNVAELASLSHLRRLYFVEYGDFICEPGSARIKIPARTAECVELYGQMCGAYSAVVSVRLEQGGTNQELYALIQPAGNSYWCEPIGKKIVKIPDPSQDAYVTLYVGGYGGSFLATQGFWTGYAYFGVKKL